MLAVINSFKMTMHHRFPNLHFLQLTTMDDFVEWLYTNHRQNVIAKIKPPKAHEPEQVVVEETDDRIKALMGCGILREASRCTSSTLRLPFLPPTKEDSPKRNGKSKWY